MTPKKTATILKIMALIFIIMPWVSLYASDKNITADKKNPATIRPSIYLDKEKIQYIKERLDRPMFWRFWQTIKTKANKFIIEPAPKSIENMSEGSIRQYGNRIPYMALAYLITGNDKYFYGVKYWMDALSNYPNWASNHDLGSAHLLFGMSIAYDWLYNKWTKNEKDIYRSAIIKHGNQLYNALMFNHVWWAREENLLQNHNYVNVMALAISGLALSNEYKKSKLWLDAAEKNFDEVLKLLSPDGASHEGIGYWGYGTQALLKYFLANSSINGKTKIRNNDFFKNTARFRLYSSLPNFVDNVDFADSPRFDWNGPGYYLRALASIFRDGHAQWLAERIEEARPDKPQYSWLDLIWYNETVESKPPDKLPTYAYFDNLGIFIGRSGWSDKAMWTFFKAGPPQGQLAERKGLYTGSHIHPDTGNFLLWSKGEWLLIDDGNVYRKRTENHNVLIFNQKGQLGGGKKWFDNNSTKQFKATSKIIYSYFDNNYQYLVAEISGMYPKSAGVKSWKRSFIVLPAIGYLIIKDEISWNKSTGNNVSENLYFPEEPKKLTSKTACLELEGNILVNYLLPEMNDLTLTTGVSEIKKSEATRYTNRKRGVLRFKAKDTKTILLLVDTNKNACSEANNNEIILSKRNEHMKFSTSLLNITVNFLNRSVRMKNIGK